MTGVLVLAIVFIIGGAVGLLFLAGSEWLERRRWSKAWTQVEVRNVGIDALFGKGTDDDEQRVGPGEGA